MAHTSERLARVSAEEISYTKFRLSLRLLAGGTNRNYSSQIGSERAKHTKTRPPSQPNGGRANSTGGLAFLRLLTRPLKTSEVDAQLREPLVLLRRAAARPVKPVPRRISENGSGTAPVGLQGWLEEVEPSHELLDEVPPLLLPPPWFV